MNLKEMEACRAFIDEHLKSGKIRKSRSPQVSLFFFVQKKDGGLQPCQDYQYLVTIENPLIAFSPFSLANCTLLSHFSFNDFVVVAFLDLAGDLDIQI